jgi:hypothetical protein
MKYILLLPILFAVHFTSFSQQVIDSTETQNEQVPLHLREVPRHNLIISGGILQPLGDYKDLARSGLNIQVGYDYYLNNNFGISTSLTHSYNEFFPNYIATDEIISTTSNNFTNTSIDVGIVYSLRDNRFQFDLYARGGVAFLSNDQNNVLVASNPIDDSIIRAIPGQSNDRAAFINTGVRFNYYFRKQIQLFFAPGFTSTLWDSIIFQPRAREILSTDMKNIQFNVGVKIALGKTYSNGELRVEE